MNATRLKQIGIGVLATIAVLIVFDVLPSFLPSSAINYRIFGHFHFWSAVEVAVRMFIAASVGAYVAKVTFVGPAILLSITVWFFAIYVLNSIAAVAGQNNMFDIASINLFSLLFGALGAGVGALVGGRFGRKKTEENAAGAT